MEIERKLDIAVYNLHDRNLYLFHTAKTTVERDRRLFEDLADPSLDRELGGDARQLREDVELVEGIHGRFSTATGSPSAQ
jgi:peptide chain release factor 3